MAYDKHTWTCDEPITVERLNHIEDGIANAGGDCGFECEDGWVTLTEETVTTELDGDEAGGYLSYSQLIDAESIKVTFNGTVYECEKFVDTYGGSNYGAPYDDSTHNYDWSEYPFSIWSGDDPNDDEGAFTSIVTQTAGTYSIKIEAVNMVVTTTPCFDLARGYSCEEDVTLLTNETVTTTMGEGNLAEGTLQSVIDFSAYDSVIVTFNGVEYTCPVVLWDGDYGCGSMDGTFTDYPFSIGTFSIDPVSGDQTVLSTQTAGTYSIKVESVSIDVTTSPCFCAAVNKCVPGNGKLIEIIGSGTCPDSQTTYHEYNITWDEILQGIHDGVTFWLDDQAGNYDQIITFSLEENASDYRVRAYHYDEQNITPLTLYSDTTDGHLRDVRCAIV